MGYYAAPSKPLNTRYNSYLQDSENQDDTYSNEPMYTPVATEEPAPKKSNTGDTVVGMAQGLLNDKSFSTYINGLFSSNKGTGAAFEGTGAASSAGGGSPHGWSDGGLSADVGAGSSTGTFGDAVGSGTMGKGNATAYASMVLSGVNDYFKADNDPNKKYTHQGRNQAAWGTVGNIVGTYFGGQIGGMAGKLVFGALGGAAGAKQDKGLYYRDRMSYERRKTQAMQYNTPKNPYGIEEARPEKKPYVWQAGEGGMLNQNAPRANYGKNQSFADNINQGDMNNTGMSAEMEQLLGSIHGSYTAKMMEDGGMGETEDAVETQQEGGQEEQKPQLIDVELGEILIDVVTLDVIREYNNKKRYYPHAKDTNKEPVGNFTYILPNQAVIPKTHAERFKNGDYLTKSSILGEILKNQSKKPSPEVKAPGGTAPQAEDGYMGEDPNDPFGVGTMVNSYRGQRPATKIPYELKLLPDIQGKPAANSDPNDPFGIKPMLDSYSKPVASPVKIPYERGYNIPSTGTYKGPEFFAGLPYDHPDYKPLPEDNSNGSAPFSANKPSVRKGFKAPYINEVNLAKVASLAPTAYGIAVGLQKSGRKYIEPNYGKAEAYLQNLDTDFNIEAAVGEMRSANRASDLMANNRMGPSGAAEASVRKAQLLTATGKLIQDHTNFIKEAKNKKTEALSNLATKEAESRYTARQVFQNGQLMDKAASHKMIQSGLAEGVDKYAQHVVDNETLKAFNSVLQYSKINPGGKENIEDTGYLNATIIDYMNGKITAADMMKTIRGSETTNTQTVKRGNTTDQKKVKTKNS